MREVEMKVDQTTEAGLDRNTSNDEWRIIWIISTGKTNMRPPAHQTQQPPKQSHATMKSREEGRSSTQLHFQECGPLWGRRLQSSFVTLQITSSSKRHRGATSADLAQPDAGLGRGVGETAVMGERGRTFGWKDLFACETETRWIEKGGWRTTDNHLGADGK